MFIASFMNFSIIHFELTTFSLGFHFIQVLDVLIEKSAFAPSIRKAHCKRFRILRQAPRILMNFKQNDYENMLQCSPYAVNSN